MAEFPSGIQSVIAVVGVRRLHELAKVCGNSVGDRCAIWMEPQGIDDSVGVLLWCGGSNDMFDDLYHLRITASFGKDGVEDGTGYQMRIGENRVSGKLYKRGAADGLRQRTDRRACGGVSHDPDQGVPFFWSERIVLCGNQDKQQDVTLINYPDSIGSEHHPGNGVGWGV